MTPEEMTELRAWARGVQQRIDRLRQGEAECPTQEGREAWRETREALERHFHEETRALTKTLFERLEDQ